MTLNGTVTHHTRNGGCVIETKDGETFLAYDFNWPFPVGATVTFQRKNGAGSHRSRAINVRLTKEDPRTGIGKRKALDESDEQSQLQRLPFLHPIEVRRKMRPAQRA